MYILKLLANEEFEKYKKPFPNRDKIYKIEFTDVESGDKILLSKLMKKNTVEKSERKITVNNIKNKIKKYQVKE